MGTEVIVVENDDENAGGEIEAAEANAHIAERAEEDAEEAAQEAEQAAESAEASAEVTAAMAGAAVEAAQEAQEAASESHGAADELRSVLSGFKDELLSSLAQVMKAREEPEEESGGIGLEIELGDPGPDVAPDEAPREQHPYYRSWKGRK